VGNGSPNLAAGRGESDQRVDQAVRTVEEEIAAMWLAEERYEE
jgi:hypothetical protein